MNGKQCHNQVQVVLGSQWGKRIFSFFGELAQTKLLRLPVSFAEVKGRSIDNNFVHVTMILNKMQ